MRKLLCIPILLVCLSPALTFAQGFNSTNGRNHPELNWKVAETEHFLIMYPERINGIQNQAATIAEATYTALSQNLQVEFTDKIRVYLSDEDEINNGFAVPFKKPYTDIWVNLNDYSEIWTGQEKWLRKVIAHELAHIFHFEAVKSPLGLLQYAIANPFPSFWTEGLAQYETEDWDSQRGDRWLRKAVFDDDLNFSSGRSLEDGKLKYAFGNAQLRYFTEKYGDSTLVNLLSHRDKALGMFEYHDFDKAFDEVIDGGYSAFYDDWRKHVNVYYNTLAGQMERVDSLDADAIYYPGQFLYDAAVSPGDSLIAVLSLASMARPVKRLYVLNNDSTQATQQIGEGNINRDLSWSKDASHIFYSRMVRGKHASLINDVFSYNLKSRKEKQLTFNRKAKFPTPTGRQNEIAYIVNEHGTGNLFVLNLTTGKERQITHYSGDVQLLWPLWIEAQNQWLIYRFGEDGSRNLVLFNPETEQETPIDSSATDNRKAVLSPDGNKIAYISLRDQVPNIFVYDFETQSESRFTNLFTGGEVYGWVSNYDSTGREHLLVEASENRSEDKLYFVSAHREVFQPAIELPKTYGTWRYHRPPHTIDRSILPDSSLIADSYRYHSFKNLTHVATFGLPYYSSPDDWGIFATTNWIEPLGKHMISAGGWLSIADPLDKSYGVISYINNQFYPTLTFSLFSMPENGQFYGDKFLVEKYQGGEVAATWPLDLFSAPYQSSNLNIGFRHFTTDPFNKSRYFGTPNVTVPRSARVSEFQFSWQIKKQRPWRDNSYHPLDGTGLKLSVHTSQKIFGAEVEALTTDLNAYTIVPFIGLNRILLHGRFLSQWGNPLPQNYIGLSRYDNVSINLPAQFPLRLFGNNERVRGYREFITGDKVGFGSFEYRMPVVSSLQTQLLGFLQFGGASVAVFTEGAVVGNGASETEEKGTIYRWGSGAEIKNQVSVFGLTIAHSLGIAQPTKKLFTSHKYDLYYRVKAVLPF
jgi:hypothetical protein